MIRVLIVDDDRLARQGLLTTFPWTQFHMRVVGDVQNGALALAFVKSQPVDLVFVDLEMPTMSGLEFMGQCRRESRNIQFVVLTFHEEFPYVQQALHLGVLDYISKLQLESADYGSILQSILEKYECTVPTSTVRDKATAEYGLDMRGIAENPAWRSLEQEWLSLFWVYRSELFSRLIELCQRLEPPPLLLERLFVQVGARLEETFQMRFPPVPLNMSARYFYEWLPGFRDGVRALAMGHVRLSVMPACVLHGSDFIEKHLERELNSECVAARVNLSRSYFSTLFKKYTGQSYHEYVRTVRMTAAKDLLIGGKTVAEAMTAIGMVDYAYFTKAFTKTIGTSPLQIKRDNCPENREHLSP